MSTFYDLMVAAAAPKPIENIRGYFITSITSITSNITIISSGFTINNITISKYYTLNVYNSGLANSLTVSNGTFNVYSGGSINNLNIKGGTPPAYGTIYSNGNLSNLTIEFGGRIINSGTINYTTNKRNIK